MVESRCCVAYSWRMPMGSALKADRAFAAAWIRLQGIRNHARRERRRLHRKRAYVGSLIDKWLRVRNPYRTNETPSGEEMLAQILGVGEGWAKVLLYDRKDKRLTGGNAERLASDLEFFISEAQRLVVELREHADRHRAGLKRPGGKVRRRASRV